MKKSENKIKKEKTDKRQIITRILAIIVLILLVVPSCSTFIYYLVSSLQK